MLRRFSAAAAVGAVLLLSGTNPASAQYGGYGGWGGWGGGAWGGGGGVTATGDIARGYGALAAGAGYYNEQTAVANSINANTAMNWNEYWYQSQQAVNHKYYQRIAAKQASNVKSHKELYARLRDNPNQYDIYRGDALNVIYDELCSPKIYLRGLKTGGTKFPGEMIRDVPFQYAQAAVTSTVHQVMTKGSAPAILKTAVFQPENQQMAEIAQKIRDENEKDGTIDPETLDAAEETLKKLQAKVATNLKAGSKDRQDAERFLKSALGLSRMLRTPAINVLLSDVSKHPEATVGDLLLFMKSFNLRFGVADDPRERAVYNELYPLLVKLRDEAYPDRKPEAPSPDASGNADSPLDFFSEMDAKSAAKTPAPPAPKAK